MTPFAYDSPAAALGAILPRLMRVASETLAVEDAPGRVLAEPVTTDRPSPSADVSAMDGYAMRAQDAAEGSLPVAREIRIGTDPGELEPGAAVRIVTGAAVPRGATTIVKREDVTEHEDRIELTDPASVKADMHIRRKGENLGEGEEAAPAGALVTPAIIGALSTFGRVSVNVRKRVRVAIVVTGDEVKAAGENVSDYELRDSNGPAATAMLGLRPWIEVVGAVRIGDDPKALRTAIGKSLESCDAVVLTGGVSMGTRDFVPPAVADAGAEILFHKLPQRPGKPMLAAVTDDGRAVFGLPGNPVSVMATCRRIVIPALAAMTAMPPHHPPIVEIEDPDDATLDLWWHRLVQLSSPGKARLIAGRGSGDVPAAARSDGFVEIPPGQTGPGPWPLYLWA